MLGTVRGFQEAQSIVGVEWDTLTSGHEGNGRGTDCSKGKWWYMPEYTLRLVTRPSLHITTDGTTTTAALIQNDTSKTATTTYYPESGKPFSFEFAAKKVMDKLFGNKEDVSAPPASSGVDWNAFNSSKLAVNCRTEEDAKAFLKEVEQHSGAKWSGKNEPTLQNHWSVHREETCYFVYPSDRHLVYSSTGYESSCGIPVTEYPAPVTTSEVDWPEFEKGHVLVHCATEKAAKRFMVELHKALPNLTWVKEKETITDTLDGDKFQGKDTHYSVARGGLGWSRGMDGPSFYGKSAILQTIEFPEEPAATEPKANKYGWKVGDLGQVISPRCATKFKMDDIVKLIIDDGSLCPKFECVSEPRKGVTAFEEYDCLCHIREVKRPAKVGEYVRVIKVSPCSFSNSYHVGDIFKVLRLDCTKDPIFAEPNSWLNDDEYLVLEGYEPAEKQEFRPYLSCNGTCVGYIGEPARSTDLVGRKLFVGDTTDFYVGEKWVREQPTVTENLDVSAGIQCTAYVNGRHGGLSIMKKRSHTEVADGEIVGGVKYIKTEATARENS
jgi:hypothetical protein